MSGAERPVREFLSDWHVWMGVAYFAIVAILIWQISLSNAQNREEASRTATQKAAAATQVGQCFVSLKNAPVTVGFIDAHEAIIDNGLLANEASLKASPPNDPLRQVRVKSILRLKAAQANVKQLRALIKASTPTKAKCVRLAQMLGVDPSRYLKKPKPTKGAP